MKPIYLKFPDEKTALDLLKPYAPVRPDGKLAEGEDKDGFSVVLLGALVSSKTELPIEGYHVNMLVPDSEIETLAEHQILPDTPSAVFGGFSPEELAAATKEIANG